MSFEKVGTWWANREIELIKIDGKVYALDGWNGEKYLDCWECIGDEYMEVGEQYIITPIIEVFDDEFKTVKYEVFPK
ncbi:hypothetical protein [Siminovitchia sp. 179-K 8D1 HS]|uniref:hypothetical protein n=1 Tax=Siminovitchia sp. 179-K 8D1 HS TaxID=3142385 RepID=UPI0039A3E1A3